MSKLELPMGFGAALIQNELAMKNFEALTEEEKLAVIEKTHRIQSKSQMQSFVNGLARGTSLFKL